MQRNRPPSPQMIRVLQALAADPTQWRYGYDLGNEVDLKSGSLYPILIRLADRGLLEAAWDTPVEGKPPRHLYRLTPSGRELLAATAAAQIATSKTTKTSNTIPAVHRRSPLKEA